MSTSDEIIARLYTASREKSISPGSTADSEHEAGAGARNFS
jgi:hypothetical protein